MNMYQDLKEYIDQHQIFTNKDKIIVSVSGGIDSVILCHLFKLLDVNFIIAHCNYHLRGEESNEDERFVKNLAKELEIDFISVDIATTAIAQKNKKSIQITARETRYQWLEQQRQRLNYDYIATAHHINDSIETAIYNFSKGSGIRGIRGLLPKNGRIIHPMLFTDKVSIRQYSTENSIPCREDASNALDKYSRNKIRLHVVPVLKKINPSLEKTAQQNFDNLRDVEEVYLWAIEGIKQKVVSTQGNTVKIHYPSLKDYPAPQTVLYELLRPYGFNNSQSNQLLKNSDSGIQFLSKSHRLVVNRNTYLIEPYTENIHKDHFTIEAHQKTISLPSGNLEIKILDAIPSILKTPPNIVYLDLDKLSFPLTLRHWQSGDFFQPLGMKGKRKKLQDFFTDRKLSILEKGKVWILETNNKIAWIVNHRLDERFKLSQNSNKVLKLEWIKN